MSINNNLSPIELIREYLKNNGYSSTLECFDKERAYKKIGEDNNKDNIKDNIIESRLNILANMEEGQTLIKERYKSLQQSARHVYALVISCIQELINIKDGKKNNLEKTIEDYKTQIGRYHKLILSDEWDEKTNLVNQAILLEHRKRLLKGFADKNDEVTLETLLTLRLYGIEMKAQEFKRSYINEIIKNDLLLTSEHGDKFMINVLDISNYSIKQTFLAFSVNDSLDE
jgi:hypothetical protein